MTISIDRRRLLQLAGAATTLNLSAQAARADAPPAAPTTPMPPVEAYAVPFVDEIALSPDGTRVAVISQRGDEKVLTHLKVGEDKGSPMSLGPAKVRGLMFGDNSHVVVLSSFTDSVGGKRELSLGYVIDLDALKALKLFDQTDDATHAIYGNVGRIKLDGEYRVTASTMQFDNAWSLCLFSFDLNKYKSFLPGRRLDKGSHDTESWVVTPDGYPLACAEYSDLTKTWRVLVNHAEPGQVHQMQMVHESHDVLFHPQLIGLGRDGNSIVIFDALDGRSGYHYEISRDGVMSPALDPDDDGHDRTALFHPLTRRLVGFARHDDWFDYDYSDPLLKKLAESLKAAMGDEIRSLVADRAEDPRKLIAYTEGPGDAGSYYFIDFATGATQSLVSNYPGIPAEWVSHKTVFNYTASDGLAIHAYLTLPPFGTGKNLPLVVLPHAAADGRDYIDFDWQAQLLASRGYAVLQPNFRGSTGYGRAFIEKGYGQWGRRMQSDLSDGVRRLAADGVIDSRRVAILGGGTYGGYAALAGATLDPGTYRCAISAAGISDLSAFVDAIALRAEDSQTDRVRYWKQLMGDPAGYAQVSPARQAGNAGCPVLLLHGEDDVVVPIEQSRRMESALKAAGKTVEFIAFKGQDHWDTVGSARVDMMNAAMAFLDRYNPAG